MPMSYYSARAAARECYPYAAAEATGLRRSSGPRASGPGQEVLRPLRVELRDQLLRRDRAVALLDPLHHQVHRNALPHQELGRDPPALAEPVARRLREPPVERALARRRELDAHRDRALLERMAEEHEHLLPDLR